MAAKSNDDIAKALANLSHDEPEHATPGAQQHQGEPAKPSRVRPAEPAPEATPPQVRASMPAGAAAKNADQHLEMKRTLIPILLVMGGMLVLGGLLCLLLGEESPIEGAIVPLLMLALGGLIVAAGAATIMQVKHSLSNGSKR